MNEACAISRWLPWSWPISVRVPLVVALLMVAISLAVSDRVLSRLEETQERDLQQLASAYLDGLSASLIPSVVREDAWEVFDTLDRSHEIYQSLNVQWAAVTDSQDHVIAASDPRRFPTFDTKPPEAAKLFDGTSEVTLDVAGATARMYRPLIYQEREIGKIFAQADIANLTQVRADVLKELILTNALLTLFLTGVGYLAVRRMLKPISLLSSHLVRGGQGVVEPISAITVSRQSHEFRRLFVRYNTMTQAINEREVLAAQLAEEEKLASLGRMASSIAHEINNPLGGMFNALHSLKKYGVREDVRATSIRLLEQGLTGIRDLVRSTLTSYRADQRPRDLSVVDLDDLRLLVKPEARQRKLQLDWRNDVVESLHIPAIPVRDAVLNLLINACHSSPPEGSIGFWARADRQNFVVDISDQGGGLPPHIREYLERKRAGSAPLDRRSGLGLWIVKRLCDQMHGELMIVQSSRNGTTIRLTVGLNPLDMKHVA